MSQQELEERRNSFLPVTGLSIKRGSIDSFSSSIMNSSLSIPSDSSVESTDVALVQNTTRDLIDLMNARVTAFMYFREKLSKGPDQDFKSSILQLSQLKDSIKFIEEQKESLTEKEKIKVDCLVKTLNELHSVYEKELEELELNRSELITLEGENDELNSKLQDMQNNLSRLNIEFEKERASCFCLIF
ncbi:hypothetical protein SteCoe_19923 [Stentor coeruleus]|uniref:Uncharacterized protein n=1 Tax=Stentor coeruleus TaxID=5963 RepID=A0A1R2BSZ2_9CILI|nr:hypothetical protein SteCoe_19923 [Stentor coeruleus]